MPSLASPLEEVVRLSYDVTVPGDDSVLVSMAVVECSVMPSVGAPSVSVVATIVTVSCCELGTVCPVLSDTSVSGVLEVLESSFVSVDDDDDDDSNVVRGSLESSEVLSLVVSTSPLPSVDNGVSSPLVLVVELVTLINPSGSVVFPARHVPVAVIPVSIGVLWYWVLVASNDVRMTPAGSSELVLPMDPVPVDIGPSVMVVVVARSVDSVAGSEDQPSVPSEP